MRDEPRRLADHHDPVVRVAHLDRYVLGLRGGDGGFGDAALDDLPLLEPVARANFGSCHPNPSRTQRPLGPSACHPRPARQDDVHSLPNLVVSGREPDQLARSPRSSLPSALRSARKLMTSSARTPMVMAESATLKTGHTWRSTKSTTRPSVSRRTRSNRLPNPPPSTSPRGIAHVVD